MFGILFASSICAEAFFPPCFILCAFVVPRSLFLQGVSQWNTQVFCYLKEFELVLANRAVFESYFTLKYKKWIS